MSEEFIKNNNEENDQQDVLKNEEVSSENENVQEIPNENDQAKEQQSENILQEDDLDDDSPFEGKVGREYTYSLNYDDIINGLALLANVNKPKSEKIQDFIVCLLTAVAFATAIITKNVIAIVAVCVCMGYVYFKLMKPVNYRRRAARVIDKRKDEYKAIFYDNGIKIIENGTEREFLYDKLSYYDHKDLMLLTKNGLVIILPKRYFKDDVETLKETFKKSFRSFTD